jgi:uncharacterized protein YegL
MNADGGTVSPLNYCYDKLCNSKDKPIIVVLTDGDWGNQREAINTADRCKREGIDIIAIGFGDANEKFLKRISSVSLMTNLESLVESFSTIAQELTQTGGVNSLNRYF